MAKLDPSLWLWLTAVAEHVIERTLEVSNESPPYIFGRISVGLGSSILCILGLLRNTMTVI
jgi:hypothetical protein